MANPKSEYGDTALWQGYSLHQPITSVSNPPAFQSTYQTPVSYHDQQPRGGYRPLEIPPYTRPPPLAGGAVLTTSSSPLHAQHSYPSLKRTFDQSEHPYGDGIQDFREGLQDAPKPAVNQDHRLLSFGKLPEKHTILDSQGRVQRIDLAAQLHGMFFLSELATTPGEASMAKPELTCYRRNLFQISGSVTMPRGSLAVLNERGERIPIVSMEVVISATESVDGHVVKLIVIPWKTPPPNSPEIPSGQEHEPTPIPLQPFEDGLDTNSEPTSYPIAYRRLQFRIATANNGRRRELQQHFTLHLNVVGTLTNGTKANVCETSTAPIVVRGRSPRNFQARKEIPLVGSSSSRGNPPELQVATSMMAASSDTKAKLAKLGGIELPRTAFTFDSSTLSGSPSMVRQPSYATWNPAHPPDQSTPQNPPTYPSSMENYLPVQTPTDAHTNTQSPNSVSPLTTRQPYGSYHPLSAASTTDPNRYFDSNPRPTKSPRHAAPPPERSTGVPYSDIGSRYAQQTYHGDSQAQSPIPNRAPAYFPQAVPLQQQQQTIQPQAWTTAPEAPPQYGTAGGVQVTQAYEYPTAPYVKAEPVQQQQQPQSLQSEHSLQPQQQQHQNYTWNPT